jgi:hypothetical protein
MQLDSQSPLSSLRNGILTKPVLLLFLFRALLQTGFMAAASPDPQLSCL